MRSAEKPSPDWETGSRNTPENTQSGERRHRSTGNWNAKGTRGETRGYKKAGSLRKIRPPARAEDTRFELVRLLHQHAFQACAIDH